jgi:hypothetical protein
MLTTLPMTPNNPLGELEVIVGNQHALRTDRDRLLAACRNVDHAADLIILGAEDQAQADYGGHMPQFLEATVSTAKTLRGLVADAIRQAGLADAGKGG